MREHILTKEQRDAGLDTYQDDHNIYIEDIVTGQVIAVLGYRSPVQVIQQAANDYLIKKAGKI
jgi:hypothetical protein